MIEEAIAEVIAARAAIGTIVARRQNLCALTDSLNVAQAIRPILDFMNYLSRAGSFGAGLALGISGLATVAVLHANHNSTSNSKLAPAKSGSVQTISNTNPDTAKRVYAHAKDAVAYISATQAQGQATARASSSPQTARS